MRTWNNRPWFAGLALLVLVLAVAGCNPFATKGTVPPPPPGGGLVDPQNYPDYIGAWNREGTAIAGYVPKACLFPGTISGQGQAASCPVYAADLLTLVGHMVPDKGFVPLGVDPGTIPNIPARAAPSQAPPAGTTTSLTTYVRSAVAPTTWLAIRTTGGDVLGASSYNGGGVECDNIPVGGQLVLLDRPPQDPGAQTLRTIYARGQASGPATLWVDIAADGTVRQGEGVPGWWQGPPQAC
jgi:hypothetical protein